MFPPPWNMAARICAGRFTRFPPSVLQPGIVRKKDDVSAPRQLWMVQKQHRPCRNPVQISVIHTPSSFDGVVPE